MVTLPKALITVGTFLEIVGVGLVFWQVAQTERDLGLESWLREAQVRIGHVITLPGRWLKACLGRAPSTEGSLSAAGRGSAISSGWAVARVRHGRDGDADQQLSSLWAEIDRLFDEIDRLRREMNLGRAEFLQQLADTGAELNRTLTELTARLETFGRSSRTAQVSGALLILAGLILVGLAGWFA